VSINSAPSTWDRIRELVEQGEPNPLALAVDDIRDEDRRALAAPLRRYDPPHRPGWDQFRMQSLLAIVGAGVLPDAKPLGVWLSRKSLSYGHRHDSTLTDVVAHVMFVLTRRKVSWLPQLTQELAARLSIDPRMYDSGERIELIQRLTEVTGQPPPLTDGVVVGWTACTAGQDTAVAAVAKDPRLIPLVLRMFEIDQVGAQFDARPFWATTMAELAMRGLVPRDAMLDACIGRLGRPGKPGATRAYLEVLRALDPTPDEAAQRVDGYLAMLTAASTVATYAFETLVELDAARRLSGDTVLAAAPTVLRRDEKKLVRAQLSQIAAWDDTRKPASATVIVEVLPRLTPDMARAALTTLRKIAKALAPEQQAQAAARVGPIARDLADQLAEILPTAKPAVTAPTSPDAAIWRPTRLDGPADIDHLADDVQGLFDWSVSLHAARLERVIEGVLDAKRTDADGLRSMLTPIFDTDVYRYAVAGSEYGRNDTYQRAMAAFAAAAAGREAPQRQTDESDWPGRNAGHVVIDRIWALAEVLRDPVPTAALSRPSWDSGLIDPDQLVERLTRASRIGVDASAVELEQALLGAAAERSGGA
jgi:hypothetical protein